MKGPSIGLSRLPHPVKSPQLWLFDGEPWDGQSPRALTAGQMLLSLRREPLSHEVGTDPMQLDFFRGRKEAIPRKRLRQAAGAPSLLPLKAATSSLVAARRGSRKWGDNG